MWSSVKNIFASVPSWFRNIFSNAWNGIKSVFSSWGSFFSGLWDKIKTTFSKLGTSIGNAISNSVKSGINGVISRIESIINSGINLINGAINLINLLPGVNVGHIGGLSLPRLAKGGIVDRPTLAEIGEDGREAIVPLEHNTEWIGRVAAEVGAMIEKPLISLAEAVSTNLNSDYNYNEMVEAFKDALGQMKITLDDEELGTFVEKTVADAIFT